MADEQKPETNSRNFDDFLATARERFKQCAEEEKPIRDEALKDLRFVAGEQWEEQIKRARGSRPSLTFNRMHTFVQQVANEARQNKPQIKFIPSEDGDKETAEIYEGLARHIQYDSDAQVAYETAVEYSAGGSFGYYRFLTDYCNDETDDQELKVVPVLDPFSVYGILMPACYGQEPRFWFVVEALTKDEFRAQYPKSPIVELGFDEAARRYGDWVGDKIRIAEYWWVEEEDGQTPSGRPIKKRTIHFCKITGAEVIADSETVWPGKRCNIIPVLGKQLIIQGKPYLFSVVRFQRDPQYLVNVYKSRIAETLSINPISPWLAAVGQIPSNPTQRAAWLQAANRADVLEYNTVDVDGKPAPEPKRNVYEPPIGAYSEAAAQEIDDMKATAGIFDASIGAESNEKSGIAIQRRQQQSNVTNMHFLDNLERAFKKGGLVIAEVVPKIYDAPRMLRILGEDETPKVVKVNQEFMDGEQPKLYRVGGDGVGKYDVVVTMGRAFSTKRMESFDMMAQLLQTNGELLPMVGDIMFKNSDMAGADQLAERFKKMLPPNLQDEKNDADPEAIKQKLAQYQQMVETLTENVNVLTQEIQTKKPELESRERIEMARIDNQLKIALATMESNEAIAALKSEIDALKVKVQADMQQVSVNANLAAKEIGSDEKDANETA